MKHHPSHQTVRPQPTPKNSSIMEGPPAQRSIFQAASDCQRRLKECLEVPILALNEWPRKRLADFNLWASDSGALAKQHASLDEKLVSKNTVRDVIVNLLGLLENLLVRYQSLGKSSLPVPYPNSEPETLQGFNRPSKNIKLTWVVSPLSIGETSM